MSQLKRLIHEIHRRSLWQVLGIYLAASWVALQVVEQLAEAASLPEWVRPLALVLLIIGFPIVMATAFVQEGTGRMRDSGSREAGATGRSTASPAVRAGDVPAPVDGTEVAPAAVPAVTPAAEPGVHDRLFTWRNAIAGGVLAFSLLFGFAGLFVLLRSPSSPFGPDEAVADEAAPAIAVLPFSVQGASVADLREGMVELLGTNLDGVAGLRTIDSRTVMARYRERVRGDDGPDFETALQIARDARARYLLTGSAVAIGSGVRMSADIYDAGSGEKLGGAQVQGSPDDVFGLVDRLSIETLGAILGDEMRDLPRVDLARATTSSLPALRAYLEGAAHFRASEFGLALQAFERAVQADSTFALAYYRLSESYGWAETIMSELGQTAIDNAARYADRLPDREASLVRATRALLRGDHNAIEDLEEVVRRYPDDVEAWYLLGDMYMHLGPPGLYEYSKAEEAFERAIQLDPAFSPAHIHYVDYAFFQSPDSARAEARLAAYEPLAAGSEQYRQLRIAADLAFGGPARRAATIAALDTVSLSLTAVAATNVAHPQLLDAQTELVAALARRNDPFAGVFAVYNRNARGRPFEAAAALSDPGGGTWIDQEGAFHLHQLSALVPEEALPRASIDEALELAAVDTTSVLELFYAGAYAADRGRSVEADSALRLIGSHESRLREAGDTTLATFAAGAAAGIEGFRASAAGERERAVELLDSARRQLLGNYPFIAANDAVRWRAGRLLAELGRHGEAVRYLGTVYYQPATRLELARAYEETGDLERARDAYEEFIAAWHDAEEPLRPVVEAATQRLLALSEEFGRRDETSGGGG